jgi:hypothetical protein
MTHSRGRAAISAGLALVAIVSPLQPARAIVGQAPPATAGFASAVVTIVGSLGNFCSGVAIARNVVMSAAHCVHPGATYKVVTYSQNRKPRMIDAVSIRLHPQFNATAIASHRATADIALLRLGENLPYTVSPVSIGAPRAPITAGAAFVIAGIGVAVNGDGRSGGTVRAANLVVTGKPGNLQIRLVDPVTKGASGGLGACTGDSGGPVFEQQDGRYLVVGVISWSTGPNVSAGCGGMTGVTPLSLYRDWIEKMLQQPRTGHTR